MADTETAPVEDAPQEQESEDKPLGEAGERALAQEREARKQAEKDLKALRREIDQIRQSSMSEAEKQVAEAEARGRSEATSQFGQRLARSEFVAAATRRNPAYDASQILDDLNIGRYVGDDGEPDVKAIEQAVARLIPEQNGTPSFDGGARTSPPAAQSMSGLIRKATGRT